MIARNLCDENRRVTVVPEAKILTYSKRPHFLSRTSTNRVNPPMTITSHLFEAYVKCPTRCWLRYVGENVTGNPYAAWVQAKNEAYRVEGIKRLVANVPDGERAVVASPTENLKTATWRMAADLAAQAPNGKAQIPIIERVASAGRGKPAQFIPIRFVWSNKVGRDDKLLLAFDALALSKMLGRDVPVGKIIHGDDHAVLKVKMSGLVSEVRTLIEKTATLLSRSLPRRRQNQSEVRSNREVRLSY